MLGIESNSIAPSLIADNGRALVQTIQGIGKMVSGHLTEIRTKRDMSAMAQEMQGLNVQSDEFPIQLIQLATRHPMALKDERGQMAIEILGKSHNSWKQGQEMAAKFGQQMQLAGMRNENTLGQIAARGETQEELARIRAEEQRALEAEKQLGRKEIVDMRDTDVLGQIEARANAAGRGEMTPNQKARLDLDRVKAQLVEINRVKDDVRKKLESNRKREADFMELPEYERRSRIEELRELHTERKQLQSMESEYDANAKEYQMRIDAAPVDVIEPDLGLPPVPADAAAPAFQSADEVRAAYRAGKLSREAAKQALVPFGI